MLGQEQLARLLLPVGDLRKDEVREGRAPRGPRCRGEARQRRDLLRPRERLPRVRLRARRAPPRRAARRRRRGARPPRGRRRLHRRPAQGAGYRPRRAPLRDRHRRRCQRVVTVGEEDDLYADHAAVEAVTWVAGRSAPARRADRGQGPLQGRSRPRHSRRGRWRPRHRSLRPPPARPHPRPGHRLLPRR